jgi:crotonobetainyl-CoA:carnitine CoA-transferase CaiB-like acyl-CoA transferase
MSEPSSWPLAGLRVLELATEIAGPYATKILVDAGADVVKVESPAGDPLRRWTASGIAPIAGADSALFQHLNASKRSVVADLDTEEGRNLVRDLAATVDLVVEDGPPGRLAALGLDFEALRARQPALSMVSITPWGSDGPWAHRPASEFTLQAATGSTGNRGPRSRPPVAAGGRIGEWIAGTYAAVGAWLAFLSARDTGSGHHVDLSSFEAMVLSLTYYFDLSSQWREGLLPRGIEVPSIEPAKDGWIGICTITSQQWKDFCAMIERTDLAEDPTIVDGVRRSARADELRAIFRRWTRERSVDEIAELAELLRIPVAPIGDGRNLPAMNHFAERGVFVPGPGGFLRPRPPYQLEKSTLRPFGPAPRLGAHTEEVRTERSTTGRATTCPTVRSPEGGPALPLAGLRVIELSTFWAGPVLASTLADMGADVIKIESIQRPDLMRLAGAVPNDRMWEWSPVFAGVNPGKRDVTLRLDTQEGRALLDRLIDRADVVIDNFSARVLENFGITWEGIRARNPRCIFLRMPAFGLTGPWRNRTGFAMTVEQVSGLAWVTGYEDLPLVVRGPCDPLGGMHALVALLGALEHRRRTGEGQLVEATLVEAALNVAADLVIEASAYGREVGRSGNRSPDFAPQGVYRCTGEDAWVAITACTDEQWRALADAIGRSDWVHEPRLATLAGRHADHDEIDAAIEHWTSLRTPEDAAEELTAAGIAAHPVINGHRLWPNPQLAHREFFQWMEHPVTGRARYPGLPMRFTGLPRALHRAPPPTLGQHNEEILGGELGLCAHELEELRERRIIGERPTFL